MLRETNLSEYPMAAEQRAEISFRSARVVHIAMPPHEPDGYTSTSDPLAVGVSFTGHSKAVVADGSGRSTEMSFPPGTCGIGGLSPTTWLRVAEPGEAVEIHASPDALTSVAEELRIDWSSRPEQLQPGRDPVIWATCVRFRMAALGAVAIDECAADSIVHGLLVHVAVRHLAARRPREMRGRLDQRRLARVTEFIESTLQKPPSLREMAEVAAMSPFHFQRLFRTTTGLTPHAYVMARRMEDARRRLLGTPAVRLADVAVGLGFSDLSHFRRCFRRQFNAGPGALLRRTG
jgi:AraC family transcriptional regulator